MNQAGNEQGWQDYDPSWLVDLARCQFPNEMKLHDALRSCTSCMNLDEETICFVDRMEGKFAYNVVLFWPDKGKIVLDVLTDGRIGSLSFFVMPFGEED